METDRVGRAFRRRSGNAVPGVFWKRRRREFRSFARVFGAVVGVWVFVLAAGRPAPLSAEETEARVYRLRYFDVEEAAELVRPLLSPSGGLSIYRSTHSLIVNDLPRFQKRIAARIAALDARPERQRIFTAYLDNSDLGELALPILWSDAGGGWGIGRFANAGSSDVRLSIARLVEGLRTLGERETSMESEVGEPAEVWVRNRRRTESVLRNYLVRHNYLAAVSPFADLRVALSIIRMDSAASAGGIRVKLLPRLSFRTDDDRVVLDLTEAATVLSLPKKEWVLLTGGSATGPDLLTALYGGLPGSRDPGFNFLIRITSVEGP